MSDDLSRDSLPIPDGEHQVRVEFGYGGGGLGKGGDVRLFLDGDEVGGGRVEGTVPMLFSGDETTDVGADSGTPVSDDLDTHESRFTGRVHWVEIDLGDDAQDADHLITPEERLSIAMSRQ
jgi:arylsulfatase